MIIMSEKTYSELKELIQMLHARRWERVPKCGMYMKTWSDWSYVLNQPMYRRKIISKYHIIKSTKKEFKDILDYEEDAGKRHLKDFKDQKEAEYFGTTPQ